MAASVDTYLTLDDAKIQLRCDDNGPEIRKAVNTAIADAVSYLSAKTELPLIDHDVKHDHYPPRQSQAPLIVRLAFVKGVKALAYWSTVGSLRLAPDGHINPRGGLGRVEAHGEHVLVYPPADGWPAMLPGSPINLILNIGHTPNDVDLPHVRRAVIIATREFFEGASSVAARRALDVIAGPLTQY